MFTPNSVKPAHASATPVIQASTPCVGENVVSDSGGSE
jgi:hypothetical protein